ncbi:lipocalin family protein [Chryseobacterium culicis]|uniref:lipocalin family protein n=1 Tax=Chryseobacterium culicis TaxID=680127 RepID=UPI001873C1F7|nr:lipocalin family protein [Chryseobacterium culicis]MBE4949407.1 lipocalin family protein [Chryseobacterium culicis]
MIKKALFLSIATIGMFSCSSDDDTNTVNEPSIVGKWQPSKYMAYSGKDGSIIASESGDANTCDKKGSIDLNSSGKWHEIGYYGNNESQCTLNIDATYDYTYDAASKKIQVKYSDGTTKIYPVKKLTDTEFEYVEDVVDMNADGIKDEYTFVFKRL